MSWVVNPGDGIVSIDKDSKRIVHIGVAGMKCSEMTHDDVPVYTGDWVKYNKFKLHLSESYVLPDDVSELYTLSSIIIMCGVPDFCLSNRWNNNICMIPFFNSVPHTPFIHDLPDEMRDDILATYKNAILLPLLMRMRPVVAPAAVPVVVAPAAMLDDPAAMVNEAALVVGPEAAVVEDIRAQLVALQAECAALRAAVHVLTA